ncbi:MAG: Histidine kinase [Caulobacteraceae bacterium]|nr:Histidine kinase [Caulobacteraceae bacterium]
MGVTPTFHDEVAGRCGVLPNFFCSAEAAPGLIERLWDFAKSAYLDNPLPSLFKERLFVHLSRFCVARYCIVRHVGFLVGHGRPAGDASVEPETVDKVIALLRRPIPVSETLEAALGRLSARTVMEPMPAPGTEFENDLFDALTVLFLEPLGHSPVREAVRTAVGETNLEFLLAFMAFIRAAHYWTETHNDLAYEADMLGLMEQNPELGELLLDPAEAEQTRGAVERARALATLREREEQFQAAVGALQHDLQVQGAEAAELGRYRLLVNAVTDYAIYMLDPDGRITSWNAGARRLKGYEEAEILGRHFSDFYIDEDLAASLPKLALAAAAKDGRFEGEGWRVRKDGTRFWANVIIDPIRNPAGELVGYAKITRDLTERRDAQLSLERTREVLFQSQKMEALGQLTGGIAHDFNNLLTAIIGSLEIARRRATDPSVIRLIDNALSGAERGSSLTHRMLVFARRQELDRQPVDIVALVHGMADLLERSLGPSVRIETRFPLGIPWVNTDANQLEMALLNLAVNARDAMPKGGPVVIAARPETVALAHGRLQPGDYVCLSLTDAGEGMDEDTLARAFDPFFTTKETGKGTGLGLAMAHGLAEHSGGQLTLRSEKGRGTTAELWLPVAKKTEEATVAEARVQAPAKENRRLKVLVVDDDPIVLINTAAMLDDVGHEVFEASSAREALAILRRERGVQLVITDQGMPHMTGLRLIEEIKDSWPELPVILATGYAELPPGAHRGQITLAKPFREHDLAYAVETAMTAPGARRVLSFRAPVR